MVTKVRQMTDEDYFEKTKEANFWKRAAARQSDQ